MITDVACHLITLFSLDCVLSVPVKLNKVLFIDSSQSCFRMQDKSLVDVG